MPIKYESIEHLVVNTSVKGDILTCEFSDPQCPEIFESSVNVAGIAGSKSRMKTTLVREIKNSAASFISNFFHQFLGRWAGASLAQISSEGLRTNYHEVNLVGEDKKKAIIIAFEKISTKFRFDRAADRFSRICP